MNMNTCMYHICINMKPSAFESERSKSISNHRSSPCSSSLLVS